MDEGSAGQQLGDFFTMLLAGLAGTTPHMVPTPSEDSVHLGAIALVDQSTGSRDPLNSDSLNLGFTRNPTC